MHRAETTYGNLMKNPFNLSVPRAISIWDFSWLERRWHGAGYGYWDTALDELVERGCDTLRIDAYPHLLTVKVGLALAEFVSTCRNRDIKVGLSTWFREGRSKVRERIYSPARHAGIWRDVEWRHRLPRAIKTAAP